MLEPLPDFAAILAALDQNRVRCVLIGGLAMIAQGSDHYTRDIGICYDRERENLAALVSALAPYRPRLRGVPDDLPFILDVQTFKNTLNLTLHTSLGAIDLLGEVAGVASFQDLRDRSHLYELYGVPVYVASIDDLIAMKRAAGRPKDRSHILELEALRDLMQEENNTGG